MLDGKRNLKKLLRSKISKAQLSLLWADEDMTWEDLMVRHHGINLRLIVENVLRVYVDVAELDALVLLHFKYQ